MRAILVRTLHFGWFAAIILTLVTIVGVAGAVAAMLMRSPVNGRASPSVTRDERDSVRVSVSSIRILPLEPSYRPAPEHEYVAVTVRLMNSGSALAEYSTSDFALRDQAGSMFMADPSGAYLIGLSAMPLPGALAPGEARAGDLVFQVPMNDHSAIFLWRPNGDASAGSALWLLVL